MKTILFMMIALFMGANFTSCNPETLLDETTIHATEGEDGDVDIDPDEEDNP